jgi:cell division protein FtsQ
MAQIDYNRPNTRARVAARRKSRRKQGMRPFERVQRYGLVQRIGERLRHRDAAREQLRRTRRPPTDTGSQVMPGTRRIVVGWIASGRLLGLLLALASLGGLYYLFASPQFVIREVRFSGGVLLEQPHVEQLANVTGQPIWFVDVAQVEQRLRQDPFVEQVGVVPVLPDQLHIAVRERQPELRWQVGSVQYLVDGAGTVLAPADELDPTALVLVEHGMRELKPGDKVDPDALKLGRQLALRLPTDLQTTPTQIGWDIALGVFARLPSGQTIVFGQSAHLERKLAILRYLQSDGTPFTYLDLRPETPFYRNDGAAPAPTAEPSPEAEG